MSWLDSLPGANFGGSFSLKSGLEANLHPITALHKTENTFGLNQYKPSDSSASDTYAALTQQQWQNYVNTFVPIENQLISYATDKTQPAQAMAAAHTDVANAYGVQAGSQARQLAGEGVTLNPAQAQDTARQGALSASLADVQGQNVARDLTINRQQSILGNPAPSVSSIAQQASGLGV